MVRVQAHDFGSKTMVVATWRSETYEPSWAGSFRCNRGSNDTLLLRRSSGASLGDPKLAAWGIDVGLLSWNSHRVKKRYGLFTTILK